MSHVAADELQARFRDALTLLVEDDQSDVVGDYLEFGVYAGATMTCFDRACREANLPGIRLIGFDSFEGMPASAAVDGAGFSRPGMFAASLQEARANLRRAGVALDRVTLVDGWFEDTLTAETRAAHGLRRAAVIMLDCDLCSSAAAALLFCAPLIGRRTVVFLDDWTHGGEAGEQRAWAAFLAEHPELTASPLGHYRSAGRDDGGRIFLLSRADGSVNGESRPLGDRTVSPDH